MIEYTVIASAEATVLWGLHDSTLRKAIQGVRIPAQKSQGTWLLTTAHMVSVYGPPQPDTSFPTLGKTFFIQNGDEPLEDIGRVPGKTGRHVLKDTDGTIVVIGGYWLRRPNEIWEG